MRKVIKVLTAIAFAVTVLFVASNDVKAEGWVQQADGYYYVYDNGTVATNTVIGIFSIGPTGKITFQEAIDQTNRVLALQQGGTTSVATAPAGGDLASVCMSIVNPIVNSGASDADKIRAIYNYMITSTEYKRDHTNPVGTNYGPAYALECLTTHKGNCYRYASAFAYLLRAAGFETRIAYGQIHAARGGLTPHSWTEINIGGVWYTCDCEMQDAKGDKYNFFLIPYEQYPIQPLQAQGYLPVAF